MGSRGGAGSVGSQGGAGSGADSVGSQGGAGSGADSVGSQGGAGSGVDSVGSGADSVMATMASRTTGLDFIGVKSAARTDLMGESSNLRTSLGIPGCAAALTAAIRGTAAPSAATGGAAALSPTT